MPRAKIRCSLFINGEQVSEWFLEYETSSAFGNAVNKILRDFPKYRLDSRKDGVATFHSVFDPNEILILTRKKGRKF